MNFSEIAEIVKERLGIDSEITTVTRNNVTKECLVFNTDSKVSPVIYDYMAYTVTEDNIDKFIEYIQHEIEIGNKRQSEFKELLTDINKVKDKLILCICKEIKDEDTVSRPFLDMNIYIRINADDYTVVVHKDLLKKWKMSEEEAFDIAKNNMDYKITNIGEFLLGIGVISEDDEEEEANPLYTISTPEMKYGASEIIDTDCLDKVCEMVTDDNLYIIPSSVHEIIVYPVNKWGDNLEGLKNMVNIVNGTLDEGDVLNDTIYLYSKSDKEVKLVA